MADSLLATLRATNQEQADILRRYRDIEQANLSEAVRLIADRFDISVILSACMLCGKPYGAKNGEGTTGVSHGYCQSCFENVIKEIGK